MHFKVSTYFQVCLKYFEILSHYCYNKKELFFDDTYELISKEVWQIYDDFDSLKDIETNCRVDVKLEKTTDMKLYSEEMIKAYQIGDEDDPYGDLDSVY